jgi:hypothetical protein
MIAADRIASVMDSLRAWRTNQATIAVTARIEMSRNMVLTFRGLKGNRFGHAVDYYAVPLVDFEHEMKIFAIWQRASRTRFKPLEAEVGLWVELPQKTLQNRV